MKSTLLQNSEKISSNLFKYPKMIPTLPKKFSNTVPINSFLEDLNTGKVMKHLTLDKYYWGQWE